MYVRTNHRISDALMKKPAICHQPPSASGISSLNPHCGPGGSSASQGSWRANWTGSQLTLAAMFSPMISNDRNAQISEARPSLPR